MSTWEFSIQKGGSTRLEDGVRFEFSGNTWDGKGLPDSNTPDWVWLVYWPNPHLPPVWIDPVKRNIFTAQEVEKYIDQKWPLP